MIKKSLVVFMMLVFLASCAQKNMPAKELNQSTPLAFKNQFSPFFKVGAALSASQIMNKPSGTLDYVASQFDAVTAENAMKWENIQVKEGEFDWRVADELVAFSQAHNLHLTGHVLVWHQQTPDWVFLGDDGKQVSKERLLARLEEQVHQYVTRYKGKIAAWDVVNEALNDDGSYRNSKWFEVLGEEFIVSAFAFAHAADPDADLIYNDYNLFKPEKREGAVRIVKMLQAKNIPIHGVGMQGHYGLGYPTNISEIDDSIQAFSALGVKVHITELDLSVLPFPQSGSEGADISLNVELQEKFNPYVKGLPKNIEKQFNQQYMDLFKIFLKHEKVIDRVTFWGLNDQQSWRNDWPMKGRRDYPLLIDRENKLKSGAIDILEYARNYSSSTN